MAIMPPIDAMFTMRPVRRRRISGEDRPDRVERTPEVRVHGVGEVAHIHGLDGTDGDEARIVDERIDGPEARAHFFHQQVDVVLDPHVAAKGDHEAMTLELAPRAVQGGLVPPADRDPRARRGELARNAEPEPARAAGDEDGAAAQVPSARALDERVAEGRERGGGANAGEQAGRRGHSLGSERPRCSRRFDVRCRLIGAIQLVHLTVCS